MSFGRSKKEPTQLGDLLGGAMERASIRTQVVYANAIRVADEEIQQLLPPGRAGDAKAISIRDSVMMVGCLNSAVAHHLHSHAERVLDAVRARAPQSDVMRVQTKVMNRFPSSEPG